MKQEEKLCDGVETLREFSYLGDIVSAGRGCKAAVTVRTKCGLGLGGAVNCCMAGDTLYS